MLWDSGDFYIIDFEGEPGRALPERRVQQSPLKDVAGMVRSFSYASQAGACRVARASSGRRREAGGVGALLGSERQPHLRAGVSRRGRMRRSFVPEGFDSFTALCRIFLIEKALYELRYELNNRPDWLHIPLAGLIELLDKGPSA